MLFLIFIGVYLFTMLLVSAVQQSESAIYIYTYSLFFGFLSYLDHHRTSSRVPCKLGVYPEEKVDKIRREGGWSLMGVT